MIVARHSLGGSWPAFTALLFLVLLRANQASAVTDSEATVVASVIFVVFTIVCVVLLLALMYILKCFRCRSKHRSGQYAANESSLEDRYTANVVLYLQKKKNEKENGGQDVTDCNEKPVENFAETTFAERKVVVQEKRSSQHRLQRESETPLMEDEKKSSSLSSGEAVTTAKEAHPTNTLCDEVFDERDGDLDEDHVSFEERKQSAISNRQESSDIRKDSLAPLTMHEVIMCDDDVPQEDRSNSPIQPAHTKENFSPARVEVPLQSTPRPESKRQSVHSLIDRSDFTGGIDTPTKTGLSSESRKTSMILACAAEKLMDTQQQDPQQRSPIPLRLCASVEADMAFKKTNRSPLSLRTSASVEADRPLKNHLPSSSNASQLSDPGNSSPDLHSTTGSSTGWNSMSRTRNYVQQEVQDGARRYSQTDPRSEDLAFTVPATSRKFSAGTPTRRRPNVATKLTYTCDLTDVSTSDREFNTLPLRKPVMSQRSDDGGISSRKERKGFNTSMQEVSRDKEDRRWSEAATFGHHRNSSGTFL